MANTSLLKRAAETMKRVKDRSIKVARENKQTTALVVGGLSSVGATVGAAFVDQKMGEGKQYKVGPIPVNAIAGAAALVPAFFTHKYPIVQAASVSSGTTLLSLSLYRYLIEENVIEPGTP